MIFMQPLLDVHGIMKKCCCRCLRCGLLGRGRGLAALHFHQAAASTAKLAATAMLLPPPPLPPRCHHCATTASKIKKCNTIKGSSVHIPSFSESRSPWTVCTFGVIPEQGKKLNQNSLFHSSMAKRTYISILVDLRAAQNVFLLLPYLFSHGPNGHLSFWICRCYTMF